jgi:hypothetical protein
MKFDHTRNVAGSAEGRKGDSTMAAFKDCNGRRCDDRSCFVCRRAERERRLQARIARVEGR